MLSYAVVLKTCLQTILVTPMITEPAVYRVSDQESSPVPEDMACIEMLALRKWRPKMGEFSWFEASLGNLKWRCRRVTKAGGLERGEKDYILLYSITT